MSISFLLFFQIFSTSYIYIYIHVSCPPRLALLSVGEVLRIVFVFYYRNKSWSSKLKVYNIIFQKEKLRNQDMNKAICFLLFVGRYYPKRLHLLMVRILSFYTFPSREILLRYVFSNNAEHLNHKMLLASMGQLFTSLKELYKWAPSCWPLSWVLIDSISVIEDQNFFWV